MFNQSNLFEKYASLQKGAIINTCKDEWHTKENTSSCVKNTMKILEKTQF